MLLHFRLSNKMEETSKETCFGIHQMDGKALKYECKICGRFLSTKHRILTHLHKKHNKSKYLLRHHGFSAGPYCQNVLALSVSPSVCPSYLLGLVGHLIVNRTKENNRLHSVTIEQRAMAPCYNKRKEQMKRPLNRFWWHVRPDNRIRVRGP